MRISTKTQNDFENEQSVNKVNKTIPKLYRKPNLEKLGDLRTRTLGLSPGNGDSTDPDNFQAIP